MSVSNLIANYSFEAGWSSAIPEVAWSISTTGSTGLTAQGQLVNTRPYNGDKCMELRAMHLPQYWTITASAMDFRYYSLHQVKTASQTVMLTGEVLAPTRTFDLKFQYRMSYPDNEFDYTKCHMRIDIVGYTTVLTVTSSTVTSVIPSWSWSDYLQEFSYNSYKNWTQYINTVSAIPSSVKCIRLSIANAVASSYTAPTISAREKTRLYLDDLLLIRSG